MSSRPWRDIYPADYWLSHINRFQAGQLRSKSKTFGRSLRSIGQGGTVLPQQVQTITYYVQHYHSIDKPVLGNFEARILALDVILLNVESYVRKYKIGPSGKRFKLTDGTFTSLDALVYSLGKKAAAKAGYLRILQAFYAEGGKGHKHDRGGLLTYLRQDRTHDDLCRIQAGQLLEKLDPYHRNIEFAIGRDGSVANLLMNPMAQAFAEWAGISVMDGGNLSQATPPGTPFFVWLEGHPICTAMGTDEVSSSEFMEMTPKDVTSVAFKGQAPLDYLFVAPEQAGYLYAAEMSQTTTEWLDQLFDTYDEKYRSKGLNRAAYVWTKGNEIFAGAHQGGRLHHSSFTGGSKVKCAGMITAQAGKVQYVSDDSGHYQPDSVRHLLPFVDYLESKNVFHPQAQVQGYTVNNNQPLPLQQWKQAARGG